MENKKFTLSDPTIENIKEFNSKLRENCIHSLINSNEDKYPYASSTDTYLMNESAVISHYSKFYDPSWGIINKILIFNDNPVKIQETKSLLEEKTGWELIE